MAIFVGFAFRDSYINGILSDLSQDIPKFVINKGGSPPDFLALEDREHSENGLTAASVDACLKSLRQQKVQLSLRHAHTKITSRDYKAAIADYDRATQIDPDNAIVLNDRGIAKRALGDREGAAKDSSKAKAIKQKLKEA
ncbi:MAG: tetratricopeptide repeat protein [Desulfurellaceae bacterium]|nr:tetratricopeptide repeat protein [Desulfurellaceae bacterium]